MSSGKTYVEFFNGQRMPIIGLGTWQAPPEEVQKALELAIDLGYRHVDTAYGYQNEEGVGKAIRKKIEEGVIKREDLFVVTKLPGIGNRRADVKRFLQKSLTALQLEYVDLYLVHSPLTFKYVSDTDMFPKGEDGEVLSEKVNLEELWKGMEELVDVGLTKSIGISNFNSEQIKKILSVARIKPANLQVECHAYFQQKPLRDLCTKNGITVVAYGPIGSPGREVLFKARGMQVGNIPRLLDDPVVKSIADKLNKTSSQVLLRFLTQLDIVVIPKSSNPDRLRENFQIFDFVLSPDDMKALDNLDRGGRYFIFDFTPKVLEHPDYPFKLPY